MSQDLVEQLDHAVAEVFASMLGHACAPTARSVCLSNDLAKDPGLTASVVFSGSLEGACSIHLDLRGAGELTEALTGETPPPGSALPADTVGELCNMIAGSWKSRLAPHLAVCQLSSPSLSSTISEEMEPEPTTRFYRFGEHCLTLRLSLP